MPFLKILSKKRIQGADDILVKSSEFLSELLGKPEKYIMISIEENPVMMFGGTGDPLLYIELKSIGLPRDQTKEISQKLSLFLKDKTGVPVHRMYIEFSDVERSMWGWNGSTF